MCWRIQKIVHLWYTKCVSNDVVNLWWRKLSMPHKIHQRSQLIERMFSHQSKINPFYWKIQSLLVEKISFKLCQISSALPKIQISFNYTLYSQLGRGKPKRKGKWKKCTKYAVNEEGYIFQWKKMFTYSYIVVGSDFFSFLLTASNN